MTSAMGVQLSTEALAADYRPGAVFGPRTLTNFEFVWLLEGSATWQWRRPDGDSGQLLLRPGDLALATPGMRDRYLWDAGRQSRHGYLHFQLAVDATELPPVADWPLSRPLGDHGVLAGLCDYLLELGGTDTEAARQRTAEVVRLLLTIFVAGPYRTEQRLDPHLAAVADHVRECWSVRPRIVAVAELCTATGLSAGHLHRIFREQYGCGPARALELIRLARAALALQRSNRSLAEIAEDAGFGNAYHFSRRFTQTYEIPPGGYRRLGSGADPLAPLRSAGLLTLANRLAVPRAPWPM